MFEMRKGTKEKQNPFDHQFFSQIGPALKAISKDDFNGCLVYTYFQKKLINVIFLHKFFRHELFPLATFFMCLLGTKSIEYSLAIRHLLRHTCTVSELVLDFKIKFSEYK